MKKQDIRRIYTQKVTELLAQGLQSIQKLTIGGGVLHGVYLLALCAL